MRCDDIGHGEGFARARNAQEHLRFFALIKPFHQLVDGLRLIAHGDEICVKLEHLHYASFFVRSRDILFQCRSGPWRFWHLLEQFRWKFRSSLKCRRK